jgi:hypothetical protein
MRATITATAAKFKYIANMELTAIIVRPGRYRHYKGNEYEVIGMARHSETHEMMVVYRPLYGDGALWVRPASMFAESIEVDGQTMSRFAPL